MLTISDDDSERLISEFLQRFGPVYPISPEDGLTAVLALLKTMDGANLHKTEAWECLAIIALKVCEDLDRKP